MKKTLIVFILVFTKSMISQTILKPSYVITLSKDTVFCEDNIDIRPNKIICKIKGEKKKYNADEILKCYSANNESSTKSGMDVSRMHVFVEGMYKGFVLIENDQYLLCEHSNLNGQVKYPIISYDGKYIDTMERTKEAANYIEKYFYCEACKEDLSTFKKASQKAAFPYDAFYTYIHLHKQKCSKK